MAAEMKVTAQAVQAAQDAYYKHDDSGSCQSAMTKALEAALAVMLEPVGYMSAHGTERFNAGEEVESMWPLSAKGAGDTTLYRIKPE